MCVKKGTSKYRRIIVKNIIKRIIIFSIVLLLTLSNANCLEVVNALTTHKNNTSVEIYKIKNKEEVILNNGIVDFYETDPNKDNILEYIAEQERLEQERLLKLELRNRLISYGKRFIGTPYVLGGNSLTNGIDCSGFVKQDYSKFGYNLPRTSYEQSFVGIEVSLDEIQIGDIISYGYNGKVTHSAIYIGNNKIVHASTSEYGVRISGMNIMPIVSIRNVIN